MKLSKGFTLIELMIVVAIIGIMAAVVIPILFDEDKGGMTLEQKQAIIDASVRVKNKAIPVIKQVAIEVQEVAEKFKDDRALKTEKVERAEKPENFNTLEDDFDYSNR